MRINLNTISSKQKLTINKGLLDYQYIMEHWETNDKDFQDVYYDFYLKARWAVMSDEENSKAYFDELQAITENSNLMDVIEDLKNTMNKKNLEFSLGSKLLHTRNPNSPIYDSKVRIYLSENENVEFWWGTRNKRMYGNPPPRNLSEKDKIYHDWNNLCQWYTNFLQSSRGNEWIEWFDNNFPEYSTISNVKKIDFIIFAAT